MSHVFVENGIEISIVEVEAKSNDCKGCFYQVGDRWKSCPDKCCLSTSENSPVIYKRAS